MKIKITNRNNNPGYFGNIGLGEIFIGDIGDEETDLLIRMEDRDQFNAVSLTDGTVYVFSRDEEIQLVKAELTYTKM